MLALTFAAPEGLNADHVRAGGAGGGRADHGGAARRQGAGGFRGRRRRYGKPQYAARVGAGISQRIGVGHPAECHDRCVIPLRRGAGGGRSQRHTDRLPAFGDQPAGEPDPRQDSGEYGAGVPAGDSDRGGSGALHFAPLCHHHVARRRTGARQFPRPPAGYRFERVRTTGAHAQRNRRESPGDRGAVAARARRARKTGTHPQRFRDQRVARIAHAAGLHTGVHGDA